MKLIPNQYRVRADTLIYEIGNLADKLLPIVTELGDSIEMECGDCKIVISKNKKE